MLFALLLLSAGGALAQKKPLDHDAYDSWQRVSALRLSNDGRILVWQVSPQEGDGYLTLRNLETGQELTIERASGFSMSEAADFGVCKISAPFAVTRQAKIDKKKKDEMPKDTVACINLKTFELTRIPDASAARLGFDVAPYVFVSQTVKDKKDTKSLLVLNTASGSIDTLKNIASFEISKSGDKLAVVTGKEKSDSLSKSSVVIYDLAAGTEKELSEGKKSYSGLSFNETGDRLVFLSSDQEEKLDGTPRHSVWLGEERPSRRLRAALLLAKSSVPAR